MLCVCNKEVDDWIPIQFSELLVPDINERVAIDIDFETIILSHASIVPHICCVIIIIIIILIVVVIDVLGVITIVDDGRRCICPSILHGFTKFNSINDNGSTKHNTQ